jgi:uncharacterized membrane protein YphA (DoxX/SURF4 family)
VFSLVLLRLAVGWHFFGEGSEKVVYDRHDGRMRMDFSAEGFLNNAKGPLATAFRLFAPDGHDYRELLAVPKQNVPPAEGETAPPAPYEAWVARIAADWGVVRDDAKAVTGLTDEQKARIDEAYNQRLKQLEDSLAAEKDAIVEYQHELWRLANWRALPEAGEVPFYDERIAAKTAETSGPPQSWVNQVREIEAGFKSDLRAVLTDEQRNLALTVTALDTALTDAREDRLRIINVVVTALTLGVGICLLLGFFTRLASLAGALFLLSVIASQPPWLAESAETMFPCVECCALLVLAGTGAGRWAGLDYFTYALFHRDED